MIDPDLRMWCYRESKQLKRNDAYGYVTLDNITKDAEELYTWITKNRTHYELKPRLDYHDTPPGI